MALPILQAPLRDSQPELPRLLKMYGRTKTSFMKNPTSNLIVTHFLLMFFVLLSGCREDLTGGMVEACGPPLAGSILPVCGATEVPLNQVMSATFADNLSASSVNVNSVLLTGPGGTQVTGAVAYDQATRIVTFTPAILLSPSTAYTYTIKSGENGIQNQSGNGLLSDFVCTFTTGLTPDTTAPTVTATNPEDNETGVSLNSVVTATFNEAMDPLKINATSFLVRGPGSTAVSGLVTYAGPSFTAVFSPSGNFEPNTTYTATITTDAIDAAGNALAADFVWSFTTGEGMDMTRPEVISTNPGNAETAVAVGTDVTAVFSEPMALSSISNDSFILADGTTVIAGTVSYAGVTATFNPTSALLPNTTYTGTITTGATDASGNALGTNFVWSFTTAAEVVTTAPEVTSTDPQDLETDVAVDTDVSATFSEIMDELTITDTSFTLADGASPVDGSVSYTGTTATFNPTSDLNAGTTYTATITTEATDLDGNPLENDFVWSFTTAAVVVAGPLAVDLTCAEGFAVIAGSTITSTGPSIINGDVAMSPGSALIGFPPGVINGTVHVNDTIANDSKGCLTAAFNDAAGRAPGTSVSGNIGGQTLTPGVYTAGSGLAVSSGNLTLDAQGDANGVFIFQIPTTFTMTSGLQVVLSGNAQAKNVFWQVGSSATIGTTAIMMGIIMADQSITLETGAVLNGAVLARIAAVSLDSSTINVQ